VQTLIFVSALVLVGLGFVGCVVPLVPGPVVAFGGVLLLLAGTAAPSVPLLVWLGAACAAVLLMDTFLPPIVSRKFGGGKPGMWGSLVGSIVGTAYFPIGTVVGAFLGALLFEKLFAGKPWGDSLRAGTGAFLGFLLGTAVKLAYCAVCLVVVWRT